MAFSFMPQGMPDMSGLSMAGKLGGLGSVLQADPSQAQGQGQGGGAPDLQSLLAQFAGQMGGGGGGGQGGSADLSKILPMLQSMFGGG